MKANQAVHRRSQQNYGNFTLVYLSVGNLFVVYKVQNSQIQHIFSAQIL